MIGLFAIIIWTLGIILLLDIIALEMAYEAERRRLAQMKPLERMEYLVAKYGKNGLDYYEELTNTK